MKTRDYLKKSVLLCEESDNNTFKRTFSIIGRVNKEGGSSVCYEAYHENSGRGILKEFYPGDAYGLKRNKEGQLVHMPEFKEAYERFLKAEKEYTAPYRELLNIKKNSEYHDLATFIPTFEIYHGCDDEGNIIGTTYIWMPEPKLETFDKICDDIHKHPGETPESKLVTVLTAVETLTGCICSLHKAGMIHRDINPSNFGFVKRGNKSLTQTLSLFDINSVCSVYKADESVVKTEGYCEPETGYEPANCQTDIYSIGASLFSAVVVSDETKANGYHYKSEFYDRLREMVDDSELIKASEANSHPRLRNILTVILQKCLCERTYRYENCEELLEDLETALFYALPSDIAVKGRPGEKWILTDIEKSLDVNKEKNSFLSMQYHLYEYPLYQCVKDNADKINVLLFGFGNYGQKFSDSCLQAGQIPGKILNITIVSDDLTDKDIYLSERPELADFFNIDGSLGKSGDTYGNITFETDELIRWNRASGYNVSPETIYEHCKSKRPNYIFIALGNDSVNYASAKACKYAGLSLGEDFVISYVCENGESAEKQTSPLYPLYVNADIKKSPLHSEIERMAFNTHIIWEKNINIDYKPVKKAFKKAYNHDSSVSSVLSIKYKLYSMGIDLDEVGFSEGARLYLKNIRNKKSRSLKNELIWVEHRRWVTEKLCKGWRRIKNIEECAGGVTRDERHKKHVCILKSRPDQMLASNFKINNYAKWDNGSEAELNQLDDLDRMSVELHRMYKRRAETVGRQNLLNGNIIRGIRALIEGHRKAVVAFQEWFTCMKDIVERNERNSTGNAKEKVYLYRGLKESFLNSLDSLPQENKKAAVEQVKAFDSVFYPVLACTEYRNWKDDDVKIIDWIPFILTYTEEAYIAVPYMCGEKSETLADVSFGNAAAATLINPERIIYLYLIEEKQDIKNLLNSLPGVISYMKKKKFRAAVDFALAYTKENAKFVNESFINSLKETGEGRVRAVKLIMLNEAEEAPSEIEEYLKKRSEGKRFFAVEKNKTNLSSMMRIGGVYKKFSSYKFVSETMRFEDINGCDMLRYIRRNSFITVADMTAFHCSLSDSSNNPEFFRDYNKLFEKYQQKSSVWKALCEILGKYSASNDVIASFKKKQKAKNTEENYHCILPVSCSRGAAKIIGFLKKTEMIGSESRIDDYTTDLCEINIKDIYGYGSEFDRLFSKVYVLMNHDDISLNLNTKSHEVNVVFDNLMASGIKFGVDRKKDYMELMNFFRDMNYVINLTVSPDGAVSFTYASRKIKELLTTAGKILEIYIYHKVRESGKFDDVMCSHEINWEETDVKSEFDCIITKGFSSLFIECKARSYLEQNFYFKLSTLMRKFGINAKAVLIADTQEKESQDSAPVNDMQRNRGNMIDVITVYKQDEIKNIGNTLLKIMEGSYEEEEV
ncbi:MAG: hypothetical protein LUD81_10730 [Clostridiales bacterium]|nr:hypothetical protein [Clostridiales bacterium]